MADAIDASASAFLSSPTPGRLPLLPLATTHVEGAGAVLHSLPAGQRRVVLTLGGLGSTKEKFSSRRRCAFEQAGYAVVLADHINEGARRDPDALTNRQGWEVCQKAHFWRAIHLTALGVPALVDFALHTFGPEVLVVAYGQSMGGDIFLASLVTERRLRAVCLDRASPDWLRPGSQANVLGESAEGDALHAAHCPCMRLEAYHAHPTALLFLSGESDEHVPRALAEAFAARLVAAGAYTAERLQTYALPSGGWHGHIIKDQADVTRRILCFLDEVVGTS